MTQSMSLHHQFHLLRLCTRKWDRWITVSSDLSYRGQDYCLGNSAAMDADQSHNHRTRFPRAFCTVSKSTSFTLLLLMSSVLFVCTLPCQVACKGSPVGAKHRQQCGDEQRRLYASQAFPLFPFCYIIKHITAIKYYLYSINILINF